MTVERQAKVQPQRYERPTPDMEPDAELSVAALDLASLQASAPPLEHQTGQSLRRRSLQRLQRSHGNRHVQRMLQRNTPQPDAAKQVDLSGIRVEGTLPGAGFAPPQPTVAIPPTGSIQRDPGGATEPVTARIGLNSNSPSVSARPAAEIGASHGQPGAAGWTTPSYNIEVLYGDAHNVSIRVGLDFLVELPIDYDPERVAVVRDHEIGHIRIGERKAKEHLVEGLKTSIEANSELSPTVVQSAIQNAASQFRTAEAAGAQNYDSADYPRMVEAYRGTRATLAELSAAAPEIATMASALRRLPSRLRSAINSYDEAGITAAIDTAAAARSALSAQHIARLQYNQEFQTLVATCSQQVDSIANGTGMIGLTQPTDTMKSDMARASAIFAGFTFSPSAASAGF